ncbi:MAG: PilN domain-containing protein [Thermoanaerobaculia bacterium]|nr:PilN domain-containing protein [Thermoanaerobaculia bacterium]
MIRINLISEGRRPVAARPAFTEPGRYELGSVLLLGLSALALVAALGHNFLLGRAVQRKTAEVAEAQREVDELAPIIQEVEEFKAKKAELERKVQIIGDLKASQRGPVRLMDEVSRALPQLLWLTRMDVAGDRINITGEAFNTNAVANFIENLDKVPEFGEPVLKDTTQRGAVYTFAIEFPFTLARPQPVEETAVVAGG